MIYISVLYCFLVNNIAELIDGQTSSISQSLIRKVVRSTIGQNVIQVYTRQYTIYDKDIYKIYICILYIRI